MADYLVRKMIKALGIGVGDIVKTSYGTGPYEVFHIFPPKWIVDCGTGYVVLPEPVISLACVYVGKSKPRISWDQIDGWLNDIRYSEGKWLNAQNDEIIITKGTPTVTSLFDLIDLQGEELPIPERYILPPDLLLDKPVRFCKKCNLFMNFERRTRGLIGRCECGEFAQCVSFMPQEWGVSSYLLNLNAK